MNDSRQKVTEQLQALGRLIDGGEAILDANILSVSEWCVSQHIDHLLKVCRRIFVCIRNDRALGTAGVSLLGRGVLLFGRIPRGRAKSPEAVAGTAAAGAPLKETLREVEAFAAEVLIRPDLLKSRKRIFPHPYFRALTPRQALRFCVVHNAHHMRIIREILDEA